MIRNIDDALYSKKNGMYGGASGLKDGVIIDGCDWIVKYPKNTTGFKRCEEMQYTNDPVSEYAGSHVYEILGYPVHETMLVWRRSKIAVACRDFINDDNGERLLEIRTIKNAANAELMEKLDRSFSSTGSAHMAELDEILLHLKYNNILSNVSGATERFWDMMVIDIFINNNDRNNGNWGVIRNRYGEDRLAPVFDNGASFNGKTPDSRLKKIADSENGILGSIMNSVTAFGNKERRYSAKEMINADFPELHASLIRNVPVIKEKMTEISDMIRNIPDEACSRIRKDFYIESLGLRMEHLLLPAYEKVMDNSKDKLPDMKENVQRLHTGLKR